MHDASFAAEGMDYVYVALDVRPEDLASAVRGAAASITFAFVPPGSRNSMKTFLYTSSVMPRRGLRPTRRFVRAPPSRSNLHQDCAVARPLDQATEHLVNGAQESTHGSGGGPPGEFRRPGRDGGAPGRGLGRGRRPAQGHVCGPRITFTYGGLRTDTNGFVLDHEGARVCGLWASGVDAGGLSN
jgi:hypothetical protein